MLTTTVILQLIVSRAWYIKAADDSLSDDLDSVRYNLFPSLYVIVIRMIGE
jgi:hypothetical protein